MQKRCFVCLSEEPHKVSVHAQLSDDLLDRRNSIDIYPAPAYGNTHRARPTYVPERQVPVAVKGQLEDDSTPLCRASVTVPNCRTEEGFESLTEDWSLSGRRQIMASGCGRRTVVVFELYVPYGWLQAKAYATKPRKTLAAKVMRSTSIARCNQADVLTMSSCLAMHVSHTPLSPCDFGSRGCSFVIARCACHRPSRSSAGY